MGDASQTQMSSHDQPWRKRTQRGHSGLDKRPRFLPRYFYLMTDNSCAGDDNFQYHPRQSLGGCTLVTQVSYGPHFHLYVLQYVVVE